MTFETEEGYRRAQDFNQTTEKSDSREIRALAEWFPYTSMRVELQSASEPTDIIWENREYTPGQRKCKEVVVVIIILLCLIAAAGVIFYGRLK